VEASALHQASLPALAGRSPLLRLQSDEKLVALVRRGHNGAFEALVQRYQPRLLAFCRHMLGSQEDAEDVLQEVFAAAYNALLADERKINARPWLYRIARNRCLNHLRRPRAAGQDSMDVFERDNGTTTAETVHGREEFRQIVSDVGQLPETQRTALLLREIDALSYDQIAEAMDTTIPSVKSLLVRARVNLAEAAEARLLTCEEVRLELGAVAEGLARSTAPVRRHLKACERCRVFRSELRTTTKALAAVYPIGPLVILKKLGLAKLGLGGGAAATTAAGTSGAGFAGSAGVAAGGAATAATAAGGAASGMVGAGIGTLASKAAAGMAAAVIVTAGAVEVKEVAKREPAAPVIASAAPRPAVREAPAVIPVDAKPAGAPHKAAVKRKPRRRKVKAAPAPPVPAPAPADAPAPAPTPTPEPEAVQEEESTTVLPPRTELVPIPPPVTAPTPPPAEPTVTAPPPPPPAPPATEPAPVVPAPLATSPR
jgi:RNA polymerase sigma factor (sigma-70 family)